MSRFAAHSLWPARDRPPFLRLALALVLAPGVLAAFFSAGAFAVIGMTEVTPDAVMRETARSAIALTGLVFVFTLTFGAAGIAVLWSMERRRALAWALTGGVAGGLAGMLFSTVAMGGLVRGVVIAAAVGGWGLFLMIRRIAGVGDPPPEGREAPLQG